MKWKNVNAANAGINGFLESKKKRSSVVPDVRHAIGGKKKMSSCMYCGRELEDSICCIKCWHGLSPEEKCFCSAEKRRYRDEKRNKDNRQNEGDSEDNDG